MIQFRPALWMSIALILSLMILVGLGNWQLQRLNWKNELIAQLQRSQEMPANVLGANNISTKMAWKKLAVTGRYRLDDPVLRMFGIVDGVPGYRLMRVFDTNSGRTLFVVRGFIPEAVDAKTALPPGGVTDLTGLVRPVGEANWLTPVADETAGIWYWRDLEGMAAKLGLHDSFQSDFTLDLIKPDTTTHWPKPVGVPPPPINNHLDYALTWFGLALVLLVIYLVWHAKNGRLRLFAK